MTSSRLVCALVAVAASTPAAAQEVPFRFELTPYAAYRIGGEFEPEAEPKNDALETRPFELHDSNAEGLLLDIRTRDGNTQWEALYAHQSTELQTQPSFVGGPTLDIDITHYQFGGTLLFDDGSASTTPFIALTAGIARFDPGLEAAEAENYFSWSLGGGVQLLAERRVGVRLEARVFGSLIDDESALFCVASPAINACALAVEGDMLYQFEARVGLVARF
jgi:hypothetical protein